jgi:hypothetical protein
METLDGSICEQTPSKETSNLCHKEGFTKTQEKRTIHSFKKKQDFQTNSNLTIYETKVMHQFTSS